MEPWPHHSLLVAVDSNVLLDLADGNESVLDALNTIRARLTNVRFVVTPSVFQEMAHLALKGSVVARQKLARHALHQLREWQFDLLEIVPVGHGIVERIAQRLRGVDLLPEEEVHDSLILAEADLLGCTVASVCHHPGDIPFSKLPEPRPGSGVSAERLQPTGRRGRAPIRSHTARVEAQGFRSRAVGSPSGSR